MDKMISRFLLLILALNLSTAVACSETVAPIEPTSSMVPTPTILPSSTSTPEPTPTALPEVPLNVPMAEADHFGEWVAPTLEQARTANAVPDQEIPSLILPYLTVAEEHFGNVEFTSNNFSPETAFRWNPIERAENRNLIWSFTVIDGNRVFNKLPTPFLIVPETGELLGIDQSFLFASIPDSQEAQVIYSGESSEFPVAVKNPLTLADGSQIYTTYYDFDFENGMGEWRWIPDLAQYGVAEISDQSYKMDDHGNLIETLGFWDSEQMGRVPIITAKNGSMQLLEDGSILIEFTVDEKRHPLLNQEALYRVPPYMGEVDGVPPSGDLELATKIEDRWLVAMGRVRPKVSMVKDGKPVANYDWNNERWTGQVDLEHQVFLQNKVTDLGILDGKAEITPGYEETILQEFWMAWGQSGLFRPYIQAVFGHFPVTFEEIQALDSLPVVVNQDQTNEIWFPMIENYDGAWWRANSLERDLVGLTDDEREAFIESGINTHSMGLRVFGRHEMRDNFNGIREAVEGLIGNPYHQEGRGLSGGFVYDSNLNFTNRGIPVFVAGSWGVYPNEFPWLEHIMIREEDGTLAQDLVATTFIVWNQIEVMENVNDSEWWCTLAGELSLECGPLEKNVGFLYKDYGSGREGFEERFGSYLPGEEDFSRIPFRPARPNGS